MTHDRVFLGGNDASRFAQIEALVDHRETSIDASRYSWTADRVVLDGRSYSNKPPLLAVAGAGIYAAMRGLGLSFAENERAVVYLLTLLLVGLPTAWLVSRFAVELAATYPDRARVCRWVVVALAAATLLLSFSVTLNGHTVAAALLFASLGAAIGGRPLLAGACVALAAMVDLAPGAVFLPAIGWVIWEHSGRSGVARAAVAVAAGAVLFVGLDLWILGSPLPPLFVPGGVDQSGGKSADGIMANIPVARPLDGQGAAALFGSHGFLSVSPVLLVGVAGLVMSVRRAGRATELSGGRLPRGGTLAIAAACAVTTAGHALFLKSLGGWSYGYRYLIPLIPILLFFAPAAVPEHRRGLLAALVVASIPLALLGAYHPWPPVWEPETPGQGLEAMANPVGVNLAAWLAEHAPEWTISERAARRFIGPDQRVRNRYLFFFYRSRGDDQEALEPYLRNLRREPGQAAMHYDLAEALAALDDLEGAVRHYHRAVELAPGNAAARAKLQAARTALERRAARTVP